MNDRCYGSSLSIISLNTMGWLSDCNAKYPPVSAFPPDIGLLMIKAGLTVSGHMYTLVSPLTRTSASTVVQVDAGFRGLPEPGALASLLFPHEPVCVMETY